MNVDDDEEEKDHCMEVCGKFIHFFFFINVRISPQPRLSPGRQKIS